MCIPASTSFALSSLIGVEVVEKVIRVASLPNQDEPVRIRIARRRDTLVPLAADHSAP